LFLLAGFADLAHAQIYRCEEMNGQVSYSDRPCVAARRQIVTDIPTSHPVATSNEAALSRDLDAAVRRAIASGNLTHAEQLATTSQRRAWIQEAKSLNQNAPSIVGNRPVVGRTEADLAAEKGGASECENARRNYEVEASAFKQGQGSLDARRTMMYAACGIKEPTRVEVDNSHTTVQQAPRQNRQRSFQQERQGNFQQERQRQASQQAPVPRIRPPCPVGMVCQ